MCPGYSGILWSPTLILFACLYFFEMVFYLGSQATCISLAQAVLELTTILLPILASRKVVVLLPSPKHNKLTSLSHRFLVCAMENNSIHTHRVVAKTAPYLAPSDAQ